MNAQKYNKAGLAGAGAAVGEILVWAIEAWGQVDVPDTVEGAIVILAAALFPAVGPANK